MSMDDKPDNVFDILFPPRKGDFALVPLEEVDEDTLVPEGYDYDTHLLTWVCKTCGASVADTTLHTSWHVHLDKMLPPA